MLKAKVDLDLSGFDGLSSALKRKAITKKAVTAAIRVIQSAVKAGAPKRKGGGGGSLKQAQGVKVEAGCRGATIAFAVEGSRKKVSKMVTFPGRRKPVKVVPAFYDHLVEGGTEAHTIKKGAKLGRKGKPAVGQTGGQHPGTKAVRFRQQAWEANKDRAGAEAMQVLSDGINKEIAKEASRLASKIAKGKR